jgi:hypothetical protein
VWQVVALALLFGTLSAVDNPARQAFVPVLLLPPYGGCLSTGTPNGTCCWPRSSAWAWQRPHARSAFATHQHQAGQESDA